MTYTTQEALRLAEEAFMKIADLRNLGKINPEVIAFETLYIIRAAIAQERETVVCESCGETIPECQIAGETESGGAACADCCVAFWIDRVAHLEEQHGINPAANQHPLIAYAESYEQMARVSSAKVDSLSVAIDIRQNMIPVTEDLNVLRTRNWTREMSDAWHRAIPNLEKAFDDLIAAYNKGRNK